MVTDTREVVEQEAMEMDEMEVDLDLSVVYDRQQQNSSQPFIKEAIIPYSYSYQNNYKISRNVFNIKYKILNTESFSTDNKIPNTESFSTDNKIPNTESFSTDNVDS